MRRHGLEIRVSHTHTMKEKLKLIR